MRWRTLVWTIISVGACLFVPDAFADSRAHSGDVAAIEKVIRQQLAAFARDDAKAAFSLASPAAQKQFGDAGAFMRMVRDSYGAVYRSTSITFESLQRTGGQVLQPVQLGARDGRLWKAVYDMQKQPDGSWRINGVELEATTVLAT